MFKTQSVQMRRRKKAVYKSFVAEFAQYSILRMCFWALLL